MKYLTYVRNTNISASHGRPENERPCFYNVKMHIYARRIQKRQNAFRSFFRCLAYQNGQLIMKTAQSQSLKFDDIYSKTGSQPIKFNEKFALNNQST